MSVLEALITGSSATAFSSGWSPPVIVNTCTVPDDSPLPGNALEDSYDDVAEAPGPKDASLSGQNEEEIIGIPEESEESDRNKDSQTGEARWAVLLVFMIYSYCTEFRENQGTWRDHLGFI